MYIYIRRERERVICFMRVYIKDLQKFRPMLQNLNFKMLLNYNWKSTFLHQIELF